MLIRQEIKKILFQNIFIPLAIGLSSAFVITSILHEIKDSSRWIGHTDEVIQKITQVQKLMSDAQAGARGYLLSRGKNPIFLEPFNHAQLEVSLQIQSLQESVQDSVVQSERTKNLYPEIAEWFHYTLDILKKSETDYQKAVAEFSSGTGERMVLQVRQELKRMLEDENSVKMARIEQRENFLKYSVLFFLPFLLLSSSFVAYRGRRSILRISDAYEEKLTQNIEQLSILEHGKWLREQESVLSNKILKGDTLPFVAQEILSYFSTHFGSVAGVVFVNSGNSGVFVRAADMGLDGGKQVLDAFSPAKTLLANVLESKKPAVYRDFSRSEWKIRSGVGVHFPYCILMAPISFSGKCIAILELAFHRDPEERLLEFVTAVSEKLGGIISNEIAKDSLIKLNQEVSQKSEKLQSQQEELKVSNQFKSTFLANMSHEIRTPMSAIVGFAELLLSGMKKDDFGREYVEIMIRNGRNLVEIINEILDLSKVEAGQLNVDIVSVSLRQILDEVLTLLQPLAQKGSVSLHSEISPAIPSAILTDPVRLKQIFTNVIGNAIKFSNHGNVYLKASLMTGASDKRQIQISIRDTGIGIEPSRMGFLFKPFGQLENASNSALFGTGLGLSLSKKMANLLNGDIYLAESTPGVGSTFIIEIPVLVDPASVHPMPHAPEEKIEFDSKTLDNVEILVADDSPDNQMLIKTVLGGYGSKVSCVNDGLQAVDYVDHHDVDLILMDYKMPNLDGLGATQSLRAKGFAHPILMLTANAMRGEKEIALKSGADGYVTKPIDWNILVSQILSALDKH